MNTFIVPCGLFMFIFLMGFVCAAAFFKHRYINPIEWRLYQIERQLRPPKTPVTTEPVPRPVPRPPSRTHWMPLEQRSYTHHTKE